MSAKRTTLWRVGRLFIGALIAVVVALSWARRHRQTDEPLPSDDSSQSVSVRAGARTGRSARRGEIAAVPAENVAACPKAALPSQSADPKATKSADGAIRTPKPRTSSSASSDALHPLLVGARMPAGAQIVIGECTVRLRAEPTGDFPRVEVDPLQTVTVTVAYDAGDGPAEAILQAEDGGVFPNGGVVQVRRLDENNSFRFEYTTGPWYGQNRVTIRRGADVKCFDFWCRRNALTGVAGPANELR